ncbi:MAG: two-component regulator propeller domain-containing protein [bacterium]
MRIIVYSLVFFSVLIAVTVAAAVNSTESQWKHYTTTDGLSNDQIYSIAVDSSNNIWVGTFYDSNSPHDTGGINMFDGSAWKHYLTEDDETFVKAITSLILDEDILWAGSIVSPGQGLIRYDISTNTSSVYRKDDKRVELWGNCITALAIDNSNILWIGSWDCEGEGNTTGLSWFDYENNNWGPINPSAIPELQDELATGGAIIAMDIDKDNNLWAILYNNGISRIIVIDVIKKKFKYKFDDTTDNLSLSATTSLGVDRDGNIWVGSKEGLSQYNASQNKWIQNSYLTNTDLDMRNSQDSVSTLSIDKEENDIYLGIINVQSGRIRLSSLNIDGKKVSLISNEDTFSGSSYMIGAIKKDQEGVLWVATKNGIYTQTASPRASLPENSEPQKQRTNGPGIFTSSDNNGCFLTVLAP